MIIDLKINDEDNTYFLEFKTSYTIDYDSENNPIGINYNVAYNAFGTLCYAANSNNIKYIFYKKSKNKTQTQKILEIKYDWNGGVSIPFDNPKIKKFIDAEYESIDDLIKILKTYCILEGINYTTNFENKKNI